MKLPELSESASPEFSDAATCKAWLEHVPLANVAAAQGALLEQLGGIKSFPAAAAHRPAGMERLRGGVNLLRNQQAKRFPHPPLPKAQAQAPALCTTHPP